MHDQTTTGLPAGLPRNEGSRWQCCRRPCHSGASRYNENRADSHPGSPHVTWWTAQRTKRARPGTAISRIHGVAVAARRRTRRRNCSPPRVRPADDLPARRDQAMATDVLADDDTRTPPRVAAVGITGTPAVQRAGPAPGSAQTGLRATCRSSGRQLRSGRRHWPGRARRRVGRRRDPRDLRGASDGRRRCAF